MASEVGVKILVSNDDGFRAPGLAALADSLRELAEVVVVAPDRNRSGASNSLTLEQPLRARAEDNGFISVEGTPTDCVHLAITGLLDDEPDMVVSGINAGANLGDDVLYSGTVAAAMEGRFLGLPAMAVSLAGTRLNHYDSAARAARLLVERLVARPLPADTLLNVNVPDRPWEAIEGIRVARLGQRHKAEPVIRQEDPRGHPIYWVGPPGDEEDAGPGTDFDAIANGFIAVTPIQVDLTNHAAMAGIADWVEGLG